MSSPSSASSQSSKSRLTAAQRAEIDAAIAQLTAGGSAWSTLDLDQRARMLDATRIAVGREAADWANAAARMKGLGAEHPLLGEEWLAGPFALLTALDAYAATLRRLASGESPLRGTMHRQAPGGRVAIRVFPRTRTDSLLLSGFEGQIWLRPGTSLAQAHARAGLGQLTPTQPGGVSVVLGAGNVTAIPLLDALYELLSANRTPIVKLNPMMDALLPLFRRAFAPLVEAGLVQFVSGGSDAGAYLTAHPTVTHVHITGSESTFDTIVWGPPGSWRTRRRNQNRPLLSKPITAELGGVSPVIVVPGDWTPADLRFHAEHVATMRLNNSGHNCVAAQVVILSSDWAQRDDFLRELRTAFANAPGRPVWYPGGADRVAAARAAHPGALASADGTRVLMEFEPGADASFIEQNEAFAPVLGVVQLPGLGRRFLRSAVAHANSHLAGTLGANVLIDPDTEQTLGTAFEEAIADLEYGVIAVNAWTGASFILTPLAWGAYPGNTPKAVGSGIGVVHNSFLVDDVERSILRGPFRPFPRLPRSGRRTLLPKPPWFVSARAGSAVAEGLTRYVADPRPLTLLRTLLRAIRA